MSLSNYVGLCNLPFNCVIIKCRFSTLHMFFQAHNKVDNLGRHLFSCFI